MQHNRALAIEKQLLSAAVACKLMTVLCGNAHGDIDEVSTLQTLKLCWQATSDRAVESRRA